MNAEPLLNAGDIGVGKHALVPNQAARSILGPCPNHEKHVVHLAIHREDAQWAGGCLSGRHQAPMRIHAGLAIPRLTFEVAARHDVELVVLEVFPPCEGKALLIELLNEAHITPSGCSFGPEIKFGQAAPAHGA